MDNYENKKFSFNEKRFNSYKALSSLKSFHYDKVYLFKIFKLLYSIPTQESGNKKILEAGCADGSFGKEIKKHGFDVYGADIAPGAVKRAKESGIKAIITDLEKKINYKDNFFDIVIAAEVIEHLYDTDRFISEVRRVLRPRGYFLISTTNLASLKNRLRLMMGLYPQYSEFRTNDKSFGHLRNYTVSTLTNQIGEQGFEINKIVSPNFLCPIAREIPLIIKKFAMYLGDIFPSLGSHIIVKARKI